MNSRLSSYEREFFLSRIITGILRYGKFEIRTPTKRTLLNASEIYMKTYNKCLKSYIYTDEQALKDMVDCGVWNEDNSENFDILPTKIENYKLQLFENILRPLYQDKIRIHLESCKKEYDKLLQIRHKFDYLTCEGIAHFAKWQYIISKSTYKNNVRYDWNKNTQHDILNYYYKNIITEEQIRELSKTQPWSSYWSARESCGSLFNKPSTELTSDQIRLIYWSSLHDQVYEQNETDPKKLLEDNDVFDGWLISRERQRKVEQKVNFIKNPKIANAQEIFIQAKTKEEAKEIQNMNTGRAKNNFLARIKKIKQEGEVKHHEFNDVKQRRYEK